MKKLLKIMLVSVVFIFSIISVTAHSGRTDSNGGHYNNSTGEYHYHHGYSAHSHYDMDGDGVIDCPYEFHDKTNHNNTSNNSSSSNNPISSQNSTSHTTNQEKKITAKDIILAVIASAVVVLYGTWFIFPILRLLIMIPIESLVKKHCKEESQEAVLKKCGTVVYIALVVIAVIIIPILVLNAQE